METFESVYSSYRDDVLRCAIRFSGRRDLAEELTADAFLELQRRWGRIDTERLPSWLFALVEKRASQQLKRLGLERDELAAARAHEAGGVTDIEDFRIRARWALQQRRWPAFALVAGAAVAVFALTLALVLKGQTASATAGPLSSPQTQLRPTAPQTTFVLKKALIKDPAPAVLTARTTIGETRRFADDFAVAMDPYAHDEGVEAVRRLESLSRMYASSADVFYYLGVARLLINDNEGALTALNTANRLPHESLRDDVAWYRAIALDRLGRTAEAKRDASVLCSRAGEYQEQACAAVN